MFDEETPVGLILGKPNNEYPGKGKQVRYGAAGIGYEFLRVAYPELLSSVLLWE